MSLVVAYSLFFDDIRVLCIPKTYDDTFYVVTFICMMLFLTEILIASYAKEEYVGSFFFWLDCISTVSMIPDIPWIWEPIIGFDENSGTSSGGTSSTT